ncbi:MAG: sulfotransferase [Gemmatimonadota bacterium]|jgi:hypothetical protein
MSRALARYRHRPVRYERGALPNLIVIGAMKCATTSLHWHLDLHPQVVMSRPKELDFFAGQRELSARDIEGYRSRFPAHAAIRGESSPNYTKRRKHPGVPARIFSVLPDVRFVYILRDPVERIISHYVHTWASRVEARRFEDALDDLENNRFVEPSLYFEQLSAFLEYYPLSQIHVTTLERLKSHPENTMRAVFRFLGVQSSFASPDFGQVQHSSRKKRRVTRVGQLARQQLGRHRVQRLRKTFPIDGLLYQAEPVPRPILHDRLRHRLEERLVDDVRDLRALTGLAFEEWSL